MMMRLERSSGFKMSFTLLIAVFDFRVYRIYVRLI